MIKGHGERTIIVGLQIPNYPFFILHLNKYPQKISKEREPLADYLCCKCHEASKTCHKRKMYSVLIDNHDKI